MKGIRWEGDFVSFYLFVCFFLLYVCMLLYVYIYVYFNCCRWLNFIIDLICIWGKKLKNKIEWTFSLLLFDDLLRLHFFTRCPYFYHNWWWEKGKNQFSRYVSRILVKFEEKVLEVYKHCWLLITWIHKKLNSIQTLKTFQKSNYTHCSLLLKIHIW